MLPKGKYKVWSMGVVALACLTVVLYPRLRPSASYAPDRHFGFGRRAMPYNAPGSLTNQEVYHLTAYLLFVNGIIQEDFVVDATTLPGVIMPAQAKFVNDDRTGGRKLR